MLHLFAKVALPTLQEDFEQTEMQINVFTYINKSKCKVYRDIRIKRVPNANIFQAFVIKLLYNLCEVRNIQYYSFI